MRLFALMISLCVAEPLHAMEIVVEDSRLGFSVLVGERQVEGAFNDWSAEIDFDASQVAVTIDTRSATTNDALLDSILHSTAWIDSGTFPEASFTSTEITERADGYLARGVLSLKDARLPLVVMILGQDMTNPTTYTVSATLDRNAIGMSGFADTVSQTVEIIGEIAVTP